LSKRDAVEKHHYFGEFREYQVRLEHSDVSLSVATAPTIRDQVGDRLMVKSPREHCRIVPSRHLPSLQSKMEVLTP
jgi:hypothetical protein